jgi:16S rRNA (guanine(966)-N(2))-methyltransferase RsmD
LRIVGGVYRGHRLAPAPRKGLRPTADPVREALFNIVGARVPGRGFVDLCAGTGAVGLEAFSRGAEPVWLVEQARAALAVIRKNLDRLGIDPAREPVELAAADCGIWLEREAERQLSGTDVGTVFLDPPYGSPMLSAWLRTLAAAGWIAPDTLIVVEHPHGRPVSAEGLETAWERRYGDTALTGLHRTGESTGEPSRTRDRTGERPLI